MRPFPRSSARSQSSAAAWSALGVPHARSMRQAQRSGAQRQNTFAVARDSNVNTKRCGSDRRQLTGWAGATALHHLVFDPHERHAKLDYWWHLLKIKSADDESARTVLLEYDDVAGARFAPDTEMCRWRCRITRCTSTVPSRRYMATGSSVSTQMSNVSVPCTSTAPSAASAAGSSGCAPC